MKSTPLFRCLQVWGGGGIISVEFKKESFMLLHRNLAGKSERIKSDSTREMLGMASRLSQHASYALLNDSEHIFFGKDGTINPLRFRPDGIAFAEYVAEFKRTTSRDATPKEREALWNNWDQAIPLEEAPKTIAYRDEPIQFRAQLVSDKPKRTDPGTPK